MTKIRLTTAEKEAEDFKWYKDKINTIKPLGFFFNNNEKLKIKTYYDLYNGIINQEDYSEVCKPYGGSIGQIPKKIRNVDIFSRKIKAIEGMNSRRKINFRIVAVNSEATSRKEEEFFERIKNFVYLEGTKTLREEIQIKYKEQLSNKELTNEEKLKIKQQIQEEIDRNTPDKIKRYMERDYMDIAEETMNDLFSYIMKKNKLEEIKKEGFKNAMISAREVYGVLPFRGEPFPFAVNPLHIKHISFTSSKKVSEAEKIAIEYPMTKTQIVAFFGDKLTETELNKIDEIFETNSNTFLNLSDVDFWNDDLNMNDVRIVTHYVFKDLAKYGYLKYQDKDGQIVKMLVSDTYKLNKEAGDISIEWDWFPEYYQIWELPGNIYTGMSPLISQQKDIDNLFEPKNCYFGSFYDSLNSEPTSLSDRLFEFQYYYNVLIRRIDDLIASDKGKKILMNIASVPSSNGLDLKKFQYFFETTPFTWFNNDEEGNVSDAGSVAKVLDLTVTSQIKSYMEIAEYLRQQAGASVGITDAVEGNTQAYEAVGNAQQNLVQSSMILEPYFDRHISNITDFYNGIIELTKILYSNSDKEKINFILDDLSIKFLTIDKELLNNNTFGMFVEEDREFNEIKAAMKNISQTALPKGMIKMSDVFEILRNNSIVEIQEKIKVSEKDMEQREIDKQKAAEESQNNLIEKQKELQKEKFEQDKELIILKEEERRKTELGKQALMGASFNPEADINNNNKNDFIELMDKDVKNNLEQQKIDSKNQEIKDKKEIAKRKLDIEEKKINKK